MERKNCLVMSFTGVIIGTLLCMYGMRDGTLEANMTKADVVLVEIGFGLIKLWGSFQYAVVNYILTEQKKY